MHLFAFLFFQQIRFSSSIHILWLFLICNDLCPSILKCFVSRLKAVLMSSVASFIGVTLSSSPCTTSRVTASMSPHVISVTISFPSTSFNNCVSVGATFSLKMFYMYTHFLNPSNRSWHPFPNFPTV